METQVIITLSEYEKLKKIKAIFEEKFNSEKIQLNHVSYFMGHSGYPRNEYSIVTKSQLIEDINNALGELSSENYALRTEVAQLKAELNKKKSFW